jgi:thiol-disulfide isomerase/thioredoxin
MALTFTPSPDLGNACPNFKLSGVDGNEYSLSQFPKGVPLVIMFICNHCPYVKAIEDRLIQLGSDLKQQNVPVIAICSNDESAYPEDSFDNLKKRAQEKNYSFIYLHDKEQITAKNFGAVCTPDYFVYDKDHKLAYRGRLDDSWKEANKVTKRELYEAVQLLLKNEKAIDDQKASMGCSIKWK